MRTVLVYKSQFLAMSDFTLVYFVNKNKYDCNNHTDVFFII